MGLGKTWTALLAAQVALALAILPSAMQLTWGIFLPSWQGSGFASKEFMTGSLMMEGSDTTRFAGLQADVIREWRAQPGISGATASTAGLMEEPSANLEIEGGELEPQDAAFNRVDASFFGKFGVRLLAGRAFEPGDFALGRTAVIVNRTFADEILGAGNALGRRIRYTTEGTESRPWYVVVGIVEDFPLGNDRATLYHPMVPGQDHPINVTLRAGSNVAFAAGKLRDIAKAVNPALRVDRLRSLDEFYRERASAATALGIVLAAVMLIVLLFSMAGIYTLMAFTVTQRWREIGIRAALGAHPRRLVVGIFGPALVPLAAGAILGGLLAIAIDIYLPIEEAGAQRIPGILPACGALMIVAGLLALAVPARRAIRIDPAEALRVG